MPNKKSFVWIALLSIAVFTLGSTLSFAQSRDRDNNPPGTNWENPPGPSGGAGTSPDRRRDRDDNPPGTNWENPPGPSGGPGTSPNRGG